VIEPLNGFRKLEVKPDNLGSYNVPLGQIEILHPGHDLTLVTYGSCCPVAVTAAEMLAKDFAISVEVIDLQTLLPFDRGEDIVKSLSKTGALLILDEDVPGGANAYILREIQEQQNAMKHFKVPPRTLTAAENRCAFSTDGDYYCKPQVEDVLTACCDMVAAKNP
ncbi:MAG: transketolase, partial [Proteobacteria bacterium]|nr:transketolase [Pseudomonadota bacterium]